MWPVRAPSGRLEVGRLQLIVSTWASRNVAVPSPFCSRCQQNLMRLERNRRTESDTRRPLQGVALRLDRTQSRATRTWARTQPVHGDSLSHGPDLLASSADSTTNCTLCPTLPRPPFLRLDMKPLRMAPNKCAHGAATQFAAQPASLHVTASFPGVEQSVVHLSCKGRPYVGRPSVRFSAWIAACPCQAYSGVRTAWQLPETEQSDLDCIPA